MDINSIVTAESSDNPNAKAPTSSATGLGQFINGTWLDMIKQYHPELMEGRSRAEILELRKNPELSKEMTARYAAENEAKLRRAGLPVTPTSTYLMHFAGPRGGVKLLQADPDTPVESILDARAIEANNFLRGKTASWVIAWADKKMANAAASKPAAAPRPAPWTGQQPLPYLAQTQAMEPAFGATSWLQRPTSPNMLSPDQPRPLAGPPSKAPIPFVDGTRRAQQVLDNSLPAPGAASWGLSNRFGTWNNLEGVFGPRSGGSGGPGRASDGNGSGTGAQRFVRTDTDPSTPLQPPAAASSNDAPSEARMLVRLPSSPSIESSQSRKAGALPATIGGTPSLPPVRFPLEALLAPDRNRALDEWASFPRRREAFLPAQRVSPGLPGLFASLQGGDPSNRDQPPVGGLLGMIEDYMRNGY